MTESASSTDKAESRSLAVLRLHCISSFVSTSTPAKPPGKSQWLHKLHISCCLSLPTLPEAARAAICALRPTTEYFEEILSYMFSTQLWFYHQNSLPRGAGIFSEFQVCVLARGPSWSSQSMRPSQVDMIFLTEAIRHDGPPDRPASQPC